MYTECREFPELALTLPRILAEVTGNLGTLRLRDHVRIGKINWNIPQPDAQSSQIRWKDEMQRFGIRFHVPPIQCRLMMSRRWTGGWKIA